MKNSDVISTFRSVGDISEEGLFIYNTETNRLDYANSALTSIWDISHRSFSDEPSFYVHRIFSEDAGYLKEKYELFEKEGKAENIEFRVKGHNNGLKVISGSFYLIDQNKYIIGFVKDKTALKEHEDYIVNFGAKKDTLLDLLTHNLSAPLMLSNRIISSLENAVRENNARSIETHFGLIKQSISDCIDLVNDLLEEEHLVSEKIQTRPNRFDVVEKIRTVLERYEASDSHKFVFITPVKSLHIINDDVKFFQIINNLVSNAIKFSKDNSKIAVELENHHDYIRVFVIDEGIGIPEALKPQLFQRHTPASRRGLRGERSIGIGLYIIRKLLEVMNGSITFESKENSGSTFVITLPKE